MITFRHSPSRPLVLGLIVVGLCSICLTDGLRAQHGHEEAGQTAVSVPKIFLDKSPKVVEYQLNRLSTQQLLMVQRSTNDAKYLPVYQAILAREGMSRAYRDEALHALVKLNGSDPVSELSVALRAVRGDGEVAQRMIKGLGAMLAELPAEVLKQQSGPLVELAGNTSPLVAPVGFAALITCGSSEQAWALAESKALLPQLLKGVTLVADPAVRGRLHGEILALVTSEHEETVKRSALDALATISSGQPQTFVCAADLIESEPLRTAAIRALLSVKPEARDADTSLKLIDWLVNFAERTPAAQRTSDSFLDAMELVDQLMATAPSSQAKSFRDRLRETVVRVVRVHTVEEEMRYDLPYFAVEAGRPVQVVLINEDMMPHNLVVTMPGGLQEVADLGLETGPTGGLDGKQYVPISEKVLFATDMVAARAQEALTFTAPQTPGEYPYVCTFPRHWMRMYGVMVVVDDLDAWQKNPVVPKDPIGSNRHFVQSWTINDFEAELPTGLRGRSPTIGEKLFTEATCAQCHKLGVAGVGNVGPNLSDTFARWKGDSRAVLQEIVDPSHRIDDKYAVHIILDVDGKTISGLIVEDSKDKISLLENPEAKQPTVVLKKDIEQIVKTNNSMMPKGLLDRYSKDEVFEILGFIQASQTSDDQAVN